VGEFRDLIKQHHHRIAQTVQRADEEAVAETVEVVSPTEAVIVRMTGDLQLTEIEFDPDRYHELDDEELADELVDAYSDAQNGSARHRKDVMTQSFIKASEDLIRSTSTTR